MTKNEIPSDKPSLKPMPLAKLNPNTDDIWQAKLDGAFMYYKLGPDGARAFSYRRSKKTGEPIEHTHKLQGLANLKVPPNLQGAILQGEAWHPNLESREVGGILNTRKPGVGQEALRPAIHGVHKLPGVDTSKLGPNEQVQLVKQVAKQLKVFDLPDMAVNPKDKERLLERIQSKKHEQTYEGIVGYPAGGAPYKAVFAPTYDEPVVGHLPSSSTTFQGRGAGAILVGSSERPTRVGTGLSHEMRQAIHADPSLLKGLVARVQAKEKFPSGKLREPRLKDFHPEKSDPESLRKLEEAMGGYGKITKTASRRPHAVIIEGNPDMGSPEDMNRLYGNLQSLLESKGYRVTRDPGKPRTTPDKSADVWIGHSRGADRLQWAPRGIKTIPLGSHRPGAVNHPKDNVHDGPGVAGNKYHFMLTPGMKQQLQEKLGSASSQQVLRKIRDLGVNFVITGSYAMRDMRPAHDLDIHVDPADWTKLVNSGLGKLDRAPMSGNLRYLITSSDIPEIEFFTTSYPRGHEYRTLAPEGYDRDEYGNQVWTKDQLVRWKKQLGRPKDLRDIAMLEKTSAIVESGGKYKVTTKDGSRTLGTHETRGSALRQLRAIEASKARRTKVAAKKPEFAPGIPMERRIQGVPRSSGDWELCIQKHDAHRAGPHYDLRLGDPNTGHAHSWAIPKASLPDDKSRIRLAVQQPTHTMEYMDYEGEIPAGTYGAGTVKLVQRAQVPVTADKNRIAFEVPEHGKFVLRCKGDKNWMLIKKKDMSMEKSARNIMLAAFTQKLAAFDRGNKPDMTKGQSPFRKDVSSKLKPKYTIEAPAKNVVSTGKADSGGISANGGANSSGGGAP